MQNQARGTKKPRLKEWEIKKLLNILRSILMEIVRDLKNYELEYRIEELESKFSRDLSESTFNEIRKLKKLQKFN